MRRSTFRKKTGAREPTVEEARFLARYAPSKFERPSVTVDVALLSVHDGRLHTLLLKRDQHPHRGQWALPGGFVKMTESLDAAAARVLHEKAALGRVWLEQLYTFGAVDRDPRTRVISIAYCALVSHERLEAKESKGDRIMASLAVPWEGETGGAVDLVDDKGSVL